MRKSVRISLIVTVVIIASSVISPAVITASEISNPEMIMQDVNNDCFVDIVFANGKTLWGNQDGSYFSNEWNGGQKQEYRIINGTFMPVESVATENTTLFMFNSTFQVEAKNCIILDIGDMKATIFETDMYGTFTPTISINPLSDFNPNLQANMISNHKEFEGLRHIV